MNAKLLALGLGLAAAVAATVALLSQPSAPAPLTTQEGGPGAAGAGAAATLVDHQRPKSTSAFAERSAVADGGAGGGASAAVGALRVSGRVVDGAGRPVAGADVWAMHWDRADPRARFGGAEWRSRGRGEGRRRRPLGEATKTGPDGSFVLAGGVGAEVELAVLARRADLAPAVVERTWRAEEGVLHVGDVVLAAGVRARGTVVDETGRPVAGAEVRFRSAERGGRGARWGRGDNLMTDLVAPVRTDNAGGFELGPVPLTPFRLAADAERHVAAETPVIEVGDDGAVAEQRLVLVRAVSLAGIVQDRAGAPIAGARVSGSAAPAADARGGGGDRLESRRGGRGGGRFRRGRPERADAVRTDAEGRFELTELPPGLVEVRVEHEQHRDLLVEEVDPARDRWLTLAMDPLATVRGTVVDARTGAPVESFAIEARAYRGARGEASGRGPGAPPAEQSWRVERLGGVGEVAGRTGPPEPRPEGVFALHGLEPGDYLFDIRAPGYAAVAAGSVTVPLAGVDGLRFALQRGAVLRGRVVERGGSPVADARVRLALPEPPGAAAGDEARGTPRGGGRRPGRGRPRNDPVGEARTAADGSFAIEGVPAGSYVVTVAAEGYLELEEPGVSLRADSAADRTLTLVAGGVIRGAILDHREGEEAMVIASGTDGRRHRGEVDPVLGTYEIGGLPAGGYQVTLMDVDGNGRRALLARLVQGEQGTDVFVREGAEVRFDLRHAPVDVGSVTGVLTLNGAPREGVLVQLAPTSGPMAAGQNSGGREWARAAWLWSDRTSAEGRFSIADVPPGGFELRVTAAGGGGPRRGGSSGEPLHVEPLQVVAGAPTTVDLAVSVGSVEVMVPGLAVGQRAAVWMVLTEEAAGRPPTEWRGLGSVQILRLTEGTTGERVVAPGAYRAAVLGGEVRSDPVDVTVATGAPTRLVIEITDGG